MKNTLFCFGLGYVAQYVASLALAAGWRVIGTTRSGAGEADGVAYLRWPGGEAAVEAALSQATHLLSSIPPDGAGDPLPRQLATLPVPRLRWAGYLSTTGVYGDHSGGWVTEDSLLRGEQPRQTARRAAERAWLESGLPVHLFRLSGIYGPGRSAIDQMRKGTARRIDKPGHRFSRVHVEDIASLLWLSMARPNAGRIYNLADDEPAPAAEVTAHAAGLLALPPPPLEPYADAALSPMLRSFYEGCRRVSNQRAKQELGWKLRYPTYREGLSAQLLQEGDATGRQGRGNQTG